MIRSHLQLVIPLILATVLLFLECAALHTWAWNGREVRSSSITVIRIEPTNTTIRQGSAFTVTVGIQDAQDLGAFQFNVAFNPSIVQVNDVALAPFLGSTGRNTATVGPEIDNVAGLLRYGAFTYGSQPGPNGYGALSTITLTAQALGTTLLDLNDVHLSDTEGNPQIATVEHGTVTVVATPCYDFNDVPGVDIGDVQLIAGAWRATDAESLTLYNFNDNNFVDIEDIMTVAKHLGEPCP